MVYSSSAVVKQPGIMHSKNYACVLAAQQHNSAKLCYGAVIQWGMCTLVGSSSAVHHYCCTPGRYKTSLDYCIMHDYSFATILYHHTPPHNHTPILSHKNVLRYWPIASLHNCASVYYSIHYSTTVSYSRQCCTTVHYPLQ